MNIIIKSPAEITKIRVASALASEVLDMITPYVKPGITTGELNRICHNYITQIQKATPATLNYRGFPKSICTSVNHVVCHGIPSSKEKLKNGDIVNIDVTVIKDGYYGDTSRMFPVGEISVAAQQLITTAKECLDIGIAEVRAGIALEAIGAAIEKHAKNANFSIVREYCGHGVGVDFHEPPCVLHYAQPSSGILLEPGMIFTIEPMLNAGKRYTKLLKDGWTVVTQDYSLSAQWEHTVLVSIDGGEILTLSN